MKIFITGCGNSGTTLLRRLFYAFEGVEIIDREVSLDYFCNYTPNKPVLVGKRNRKTLFTGLNKRNTYLFFYWHEINRQLKLIKENNIKLIHVIRDGRDYVLTSRPIKFPARDWILSAKQYFKYGDVIDLVIRYEDIVSNPDEVQEKIIQEFGLKKSYNFSDYPKFMPEELKTKNTEHLEPMKFRPLNTKSVGKDPEKYKEICRFWEIKPFEKYLRKLGYI